LTPKVIPFTYELQKPTKVLSVAKSKRDEENSEIDLASYIPDRDRDNHEIGTQRKWVLEAADLLAGIGGGVTIMPPTEGGWLDEENNIIIWEHPIMVYTYIKPEQFEEYLPELREFLHRMGRETNQGEIAVEFDGQFYRITKYDAA
jgi:hypothetical protein